MRRCLTHDKMRSRRLCGCKNSAVLQTYRYDIDSSMRTRPASLPSSTAALSLQPAAPSASACAFTPVPTATTRHDGWTPERQRSFLEQLARIGVVSAAARAVGMSAKSAYALRKRPGAESFAAAWDAALEDGRAGMLDLAIERALQGTTTPIVYRGRHVGVRRHYDNRLLFAALRAIPPSASDELSLAEALAALDDASDDDARAR